MAYETRTFADIIEFVREQVAVQSTDTDRINRIKRAINITYQEVVRASASWKWLQGTTRLVHKAYYNGGTCAVNPESTDVTLSTAPPSSLGSFKGYSFTVKGFDEIYEIAEHTAGSTSITLESQYNGAIATTSGFYVWRDSLDLPTDCRETNEVWIQRGNRRPLRGVGKQEFRRIQSASHLTQDFPSYYTTVDFFDPTPDDAETESDRYRQLMLHPSLTDQNLTIYIDYMKEAVALDEDLDEPILPIEDRTILAYGALSKIWQYLRSPEDASYNKALYDESLALMKGRKEDSYDLPSIQPKARYIRSQRASRIGSMSRGVTPEAGGLGSQSPKYAKDITLEGGVITSNFSVSAGVTIDGRDLSADGVIIDSLSAIFENISGGVGERVIISSSSNELDESDITTTELSFLANVTELTSVPLSDATSTTVLTVDSTEIQSVLIEYTVTRDSTREVGILLVISDGSNTAVSNFGIANIGSTGVTFSATDAASVLTLTASLTSTGTAATVKYKAHKWLA